MAAQLSNIAQFCDDLAFVIAGRRSAKNAADRVIAFRRRDPGAFKSVLVRINADGWKALKMLAIESEGRGLQ
jgi:hypothetical protein